MIKELTCIGCPLGCALTAKIENENIIVTGNTCPKGADYAKKELTDPRRIVTSTVLVENGILPVVSVKTESDIPKNKIFDCINELAKIKINAPVKIGDIVCENVANTGVRILATQNISVNK